MDKKLNNTSHNIEVRKGPWTIEEDLILINYIANHGEGVWNSLARSAGLKRTGKSCRLRWLNYLRPDVRRGNITPEEELLIMELHAKWGNRWSKIAKHLPGRTDNEIKNYWRTRIQKHLKQPSESSNSSHSRQSFDNKIEQATSSNQMHHITCESNHHNNNNNNNPSYITQNINNNHNPYNNFPSISTSYHPEQQQQQQPHQQSMDNSTYNIMINSHIIPTETQFWPTGEEDLWSAQLFNGN